MTLRFLASVAQDETTWIKKRIHNYHKHFHEKHRHWGVKWYYWLCLSELSFAIAEDEIRRNKDELLKQINRSYVMNSESDRVIHPMILCVIRNCLARFPEYEYIKERLPYINERDGRLYFDMNFNM